MSKFLSIQQHLEHERGLRTSGAGGKLATTSAPADPVGARRFGRDNLPHQSDLLNLEETTDALNFAPDADRSRDLVSSSVVPLINSYVLPSESIPSRPLAPLVVESVGPVPHIQADLFWNNDLPDVYTVTTAASPVPPLEFTVVTFGNADAADDLAPYRSLAELFALEILREENGDHHARRYEYVAGNFLWNPFGIPNFGFVSIYSVLFWRYFLRARQVRISVYLDTLVLQLGDDAIFYLNLQWAGPAPEGHLP